MGLPAPLQEEMRRQPAVVMHHSTPDTVIRRIMDCMYTSLRMFPSRTAIDDAHNAFQTITHLDLMEEVYNATLAGIKIHGVCNVKKK